jgi:hypothetical protein
MGELVNPTNKHAGTYVGIVEEEPPSRFHFVGQVRTGFGRGQCTEASIASLLGVNLNEVPDLWAGPDAGPTADEQQPFENRVRLWEWLKSEHQVMLLGVKLLQSWTDLTAAYIHACKLFPFNVGREPWARYHLIIGHNPDGVWHQICGKRGIPVWDPNPSHRGLINVQWFEWLVPLDVVRESFDDVSDMPCAEWQEQGEFRS